jgi:hypothetical protein
MRAVLITIALGLLSTAATRAETDVSTAALALRSELNVAQLQQAMRTFDDPARKQWTNLPLGMAPRPGVRVGDLTEAARVRLHDLLLTLLSAQGYLKVTSIMHLDEVLNEVYAELHARGQVDDESLAEIRGLQWDPGNYFLSFWGTPGVDAPWGLKLEGHHVSLNLSSDGKSLALTPVFLGSDPAQVRVTRHAGLRVLAKEEDRGRVLVKALSDEQRRTATLSVELPADIITNPKGPQRLDELQGIAVSALNDSQRTLLRSLIAEYFDNLEQPRQRDYWARLDRHWEQVHFAWIGSYERGKPHYYVVHSPDFIIEYDNVSWDKKGADHVHTIWREKGNDFGEDLLRRHYESEPH